MSIEWKRRICILGITVGVLAGYRYLLPMVIPFLLAWILAERMYPICVWTEKRLKLKKSFCGIALLTIFLGIAGFILYGGIREGVFQIKELIKKLFLLQEKNNSVVKQAGVVLEQFLGIPAKTSSMYVKKIIEKVDDNIAELLDFKYMLQVLMAAKGILLFISGIILVYISSILMINEMDNIRRMFWEYKWLSHVRRICKRLQKTILLFLKAQIIIIIMVSIVCVLGFWLMGNPYYLIIGIALGLLDAIPMFGTGVFLYPAAVYYIIENKIGAAVICILLDIVTSLLREFMEPRLLGESLGISPILILMSIYAGFFLFGVSGVILGPLSFSTIYEIYREWDEC